MKIHGSLFLWIPIAVFLIWLGINELPYEILKIIKYVGVGLFLFWNFIAIIIFTTDIDMRRECKDSINKPLVLLGMFIFIPIYIIPILTYYLNDKLTIKI